MGQIDFKWSKRLNFSVLQIIFVLSKTLNFCAMYFFAVRYVYSCRTTVLFGRAIKSHPKNETSMAWKL